MRSLTSYLRLGHLSLCIVLALRHLCVVGEMVLSRAAAAECEDQVQGCAAFEGVLFGGLVVGPVREATSACGPAIYASFCVLLLWLLTCIVMMVRSAATTLSCEILAVLLLLLLLLLLPPTGLRRGSHGLPKSQETHVASPPTDNEPPMG